MHSQRERRRSRRGSSERRHQLCEKGPNVRKRRTRRELFEAGESVESIRATLNANRARAADTPDFTERQNVLQEELSILEGRRFPKDKSYDDA